MVKPSFFSASCPRCSRANQFELSMLGQAANCVHCERRFTASHADSTSAALDDPLHYWIHFTSHGLLESEEYATESKEIERIPR